MLTEEIERKRIEEVTDTSARVVETCSPNDCWRQGDLEIRYVGEHKPRSVCGQQIETPKQLAEGTTKGSRHMLESKATAFKRTDANALRGPLLLCPDGITVTHPEHGDITIKERGWYAITYQRAFAEELRRQTD